MLELCGIIRLVSSIHGAHRTYRCSDTFFVLHTSPDITFEQGWNHLSLRPLSLGDHPCVTLVVWMNESNSWHVLFSNIRYAGRELSDGLSLWLRCRSCSDTSDSSWSVVARPYSEAVSPTLPALIGRGALSTSAPCTWDSKTRFRRDDCLHHCDKLGLDDAKMCHPKLRTPFIVRRERTILVVLSLSINRFVHLLLSWKSYVK